MMICTGMRCPMQFGFDTNRCTANDCPYRTEPMTNADKIRSMSDEELCDAFFQLIYANDPANWFCKGKKACGDLMDADKDIPDAMCKACILEKLRQPAEETPRIVWPHDEPVCQKMDEKIRRLDDKLRGDSCV